MESGVEMLFREYEAAREGERHNFAARSQYLGFFFTILFAGVAYLGSLAKDGALTHPWQALTAAALLWVTTLLSILTFIAVAKLNRVMAHQGRVAESIRIHFLSEEQRQVLAPTTFKIGKDQPIPHPLFTVQRAAEATIELGAALAIAAQLALAIRFSIVGGGLGLRLALWVLAGSSLGCAAGVWLRRRDVFVLAAEIHPDHPGRR